MLVDLKKTSIYNDEIKPANDDEDYRLLQSSAKSPLEYNV